MQKSTLSFLVLSVLLTVACTSGNGRKEKDTPGKPNILIAISDDQSFDHTGFAGCTFVNTPGFDRIAREGIFFTTCYAGSPGCAPSRSSLVTGRYHWQNEQSGQHASSWMKKHVPFVDLLDTGGYYTGKTGKGVSPFRYARSEEDSLFRKTDAAGISHSNITYTEGENDERYASGIADLNYFENFRYFMEHREPGKPFYFWYGCMEPHRDYEEDSWMRAGKKREDVNVPGYLPEDDIIKGDILDYAVEIDWFDLHLSRMIEYLEETGELDNTIIIVTGDNGMPFPRAKANSYEFGLHVPLAIRYPKQFPGGRVVEDPVSFVDIAPTLLELSQTPSEGMLPMSGKSLVKILTSSKEGIVDPSKEYIFAGRERHSSSRYNNWGYPQRVIRSKEYLLIWNMKPDRWPAGDPQAIMPGKDNELAPLYGIDKNGVHHNEWAFTDSDVGPSKAFLIENYKNEKIKPFFDLAFQKRPEFELFNVQNDPSCLANLAGNKEYGEVEAKMKEALLQELKRSGDPRIVGPDPEVFDSYIRYMPLRSFPAPE